MTAVLLGARQLCMAARKSLQSPLFDAGTAKAESHKNKKAGSPRLLSHLSALNPL
jgi:hypothetical protein